MASKKNNQKDQENTQNFEIFDEISEDIKSKDSFDIDMDEGLATKKNMQNMEVEVLAAMTGI